MDPYDEVRKQILIINPEEWKPGNLHDTIFEGNHWIHVS